MIKHRTLNEANRNKSWKVVAQECGVKASLTKISATLEQAGFPGILRESTNASTTVNSSASPMTSYVSPYTSIPPLGPSVVMTSSASPTALTEPGRALETSVPTDTFQPKETSRTRSKRGRPLSQSEKKSSSKKSPDPIRGAAMVAIWARRKERQTNGRHGGPPKPNTVVRNSIMGSLSSVFAGQILTAAAAQASSTPTSAPQATIAKLLRRPFLTLMNPFHPGQRLHNKTPCIRPRYP